MRYQSDKQGSKFIFIAIIIIFVYLAAFHFDVTAAYQSTVANIPGFFR